ncbi:MAG: ABC transporter ATP-binding protein [Planctomycetota bacterium]|nr:ABC transporter ATP-binding protein [Planctomycetota bacterium]
MNDTGAVLPADSDSGPTSMASAGEAPQEPREPVLSARNLVRGYRMGEQTLEVLAGTHVDLYAGESVAIMGRSGSGKSTLLHSLGLLDRPDSGSLVVHGVETTTLTRSARARLRNKRIGYVFQFYHLIPELSALDNALLPRRIEVGPLRWIGKQKEMREHARALLDELGLSTRMAHKPSQLSGGERQRVAIARALMSEPTLLLCDEPTGNLDERTSEVIADLLFQVSVERSHTLVLVTHDSDLAARADRRFQLHEGKLEAFGA